MSFDRDSEMGAAARWAEWFFEDDFCWIAECEMCAVGDEYFGYELWTDDNMVSIPDH